MIIGLVEEITNKIKNIYNGPIRKIKICISYKLLK